MSTGGTTPEELETLFEDAVVLRDEVAVAALFEPLGLLVGRGGLRTARGSEAIGRAAAELWSTGAYLADPRRVVRVHDIALVVGDGALNVARRGHDGSWRYVISLLTGSGTIEREIPMHTLLITLSLDPARGPEVVRHLTDDVVPWARNQPGFVSGQWLRAPDGRRGFGVLVFASAEAAERAAEAPSRYLRDDARAWNIDGVEAFDQVASATAAEQPVTTG